MPRRSSWTPGGYLEKVVFVFVDSVFRGRAKRRRCAETPRWRYLAVSEHLFSWSAGRKGETVLTLSVVKKSQECDLTFVRE